MNSAVLTLLTLSVSGSLLALLLLAGKRLFGKKLSKAFCYYVWLLVLARLVLPVSALVNAWQTLTDKARENSALTQTVTKQTGEAEAVDKTFIAPQTVTDGANAAPSQTRAVVSPWALVKENLFWFWLAGAVICFGWFASAYLIFARRTKRSCTAPDMADEAVFRELCVSRRVRFFCGDVATPMLLGLFQPVIIVPKADYVQSGHGDALRGILRHELTHYRRRDLLYKWVVVAVTSLHWFNPLMLWVRREVSRACELSCDEAVIRDMSAIEKQRYGETLLALSADRRLPFGIPATTLCEEKEQLKERLVDIMKYKKQTAGTILLTACLLAVLTGCASVLGASPLPSASPAAETASLTAALLEDAAVYDCSGYKLGIPKTYESQLIVNTSASSSDFHLNFGKYLCDVSGKQSRDASKANGYEGGGALFSFFCFTEAQYEQFLSMSDWSGLSIFAKDDSLYYCCGTPTDVQYCPSSGDMIDQDSDEFKQWLALLDLTKPIEQDFIARNHLTAFSDEDVRSQPYTYDSKHMEIKYYPYYSTNGSKEEYMCLVLSQPAKQGDGGIWCVERYYDQHADQCLWYPDKRYFEAMTGEKGGSETFTADDYYAAMQKLSNSGKDQTFLDPLSVAKKFIQNCGYWLKDPTFVDGSFEILTS